MLTRGVQIHVLMSCCNQSKSGKNEPVLLRLETMRVVALVKKAEELQAEAETILFGAEVQAQIVKVNEDHKSNVRRVLKCGSRRKSVTDVVVGLVADEVHEVFEEGGYASLYLAVERWTSRDTASQLRTEGHNTLCVGNGERSHRSGSNPTEGRSCFCGRF